MAEETTLNALIERVRELVDDDGSVSIEVLNRELGPRRVTTSLIGVLRGLGYTVDEVVAATTPNTVSLDRQASRDPFDLYLREVGGHRLLSAHEEFAIGADLRSSREVRVEILLRWPGMLEDLMESTVSLSDRLDTISDEIVAEWNETREHWLRGRGGSRLRAKCMKLCISLAWRSEVLRPYIAEIRYRYRQLQECERELRQLCTLTAGMTAKYYEAHRPEGLVDVEWLQKAARARAISSGVLPTLLAELAPVHERIESIVRATGVEVEEILAIQEPLQAAQAKVQALRDELATNNLRLVISVARRQMHRGLPMGDLVQEGNLGLLRAIDKYDYRLGYRFSTYATWWIRQAVGRAVSDQGRTVRIPGHVQDVVMRLNRATEALVQRFGRPPSDEELSDFTEVPVARVRELEGLFSENVSMEAPAWADREETVGSRMTDDDAVSPSEIVEREFLDETMEDVLASLTPQQARVLRMRFGIGMHREHTLKEAGAQLGVTREKVRQIEREALDELRDRSIELKTFFDD